MTLLMALVIFMAFTLSFAALPFVPSLVEWRRKRDDQPLKIVRRSEVDIRYFARGFRAFVETHFAGLLEASRKTGQEQEGVLEDGTGYVVVGKTEIPRFNDAEQRAKAARRLILSCDRLRLPEATMFLPEIYAVGSVRGGEGNIYRAVLTDEELLLDRESMTLRWVHGGRSVTARTKCILYGRVSADQFIRLERGCRFERLHAPRIEFCFESACVESGGTVGRESDVLKPRDLDRPVEVSAGRWRVEGRLEIKANKIVRADLVATGNARIEPGARIFGSIKSHKDVFVSREVEITGSVVAGRDVHIGRGCRVHGPVLAERAIYFEQGTVIGGAERKTTVGADYVYIAPGSTVHGTVWAHKRGWVISPGEVPENELPERLQKTKSEDEAIGHI